MSDRGLLGTSISTIAVLEERNKRLEAQLQAVRDCFMTTLGGYEVLNMDKLKEVLGLSCPAEVRNMLIERELEVHSIKPDSLDVCPRGSGCYSGFCEPTPAHRFREPIYAAGFKYEICPVCGTVRISECSEHDTAAEPDPVFHCPNWPCSLPLRHKGPCSTNDAAAEPND